MYNIEPASKICQVEKQGSVPNLSTMFPTNKYILLINKILLYE
jgi:hypothetical protein